MQLFVKKNEKWRREHNNQYNHPFGNVYLSEKSINKLMPLLKKQAYIENVEIYNNQAVDIDLNYFREMPINFNTDSRRWYFHLVGVFPNLSQSYMDVKPHSNLKNFIIII